MSTSCITTKHSTIYSRTGRANYKTGFSYLNGLTLTDYDWKYKTVKQTDSGDLETNWPRGKGLGGSGAINGLYWNKGDEQEYDAWARESFISFLLVQTCVSAVCAREPTLFYRR